MADVVDGEASAPPAYFVSLTRAGSKSPHCGGTLIDDDIVLTAAHCVRGERRFLRVAFPSSSRSERWRWPLRGVEAVVLHPFYDAAVGIGLSTPSKDVALLLLDRPAPRWSNGRRIAPIRRARTTPTHGELAFMGFGNATNFGSLRADRFQAGTAPVLSPCRYDEALCLRAGGDEAMVNSGDSGGPLIQRRGLLRPRLVGVASLRSDDFTAFAPVAELEDWIESETSQLRRSRLLGPVSEVAAVFEQRCYDQPVGGDLIAAGGWAHMRFDDVGLTRAMEEVDEATFETTLQTIAAGPWHTFEGCRVHLGDDTTLYRELAYHPGSRLVRLRAYVSSEHGPTRYYASSRAARPTPSIEAAAADGSLLSLDMGRSRGWFVEPSGTTYQVQPMNGLAPAAAAPSSPRAVFSVGNLEVQLHERGGTTWIRWTSPMLGALEAPVSLVPLSAAEGGVSVVLAREGDRVVVELDNARPSPLIGWEITCRTQDPAEEQTFGPFLPETDPEVGRVPPGQSVQVRTELLFDELPEGDACRLNGIRVPVTRDP